MDAGVKKCTYQASVIRIGGLVEGWIANSWQLRKIHATRMPCRAIHSHQWGLYVAR